MAKKLHTCSVCPGPISYPDTSQDRFAHNTTPRHHYLILESTGAPASIREPYYMASWGLAAQANYRELVAQGGR
jgi:hypothetical protein